MAEKKKYADASAYETKMCGYEVVRNDDFSEMKPKHCPECGAMLLYQTK